ncbi:MAG TPA: helix-turn-helix domain-containing protein [Lacipirellulaceae bacterium]|nr:helix-turn-helix domain-containing protein [Lacipirellulaceae bacterium]
MVRLHKQIMPRPLSIADSLTKLLDGSDRPIYVVDSQRRIVYCNRALADWIDLERKQIVGRRVEFHSEEPATDAAPRTDSSPLTDLCPPPSALAGERSKGTISCLARDGRLIHRAAEFAPLTSVSPPLKADAADKLPIAPVLVMLATEDLSPQDLAKEISGDIAADELHRTIRQFRRTQARRYSLHSLLGNSPAMQKVRAQVEAATTSGSNTLILGRPGSGRKHVALAIHYQSLGNDEGVLLPINCGLLTEDLFDHAIERLATRSTSGGMKTLLLENLERMSPLFQKLLLETLRQKQIVVRIIATMDPANVRTGTDEHQSDAEDRRDRAHPIDPALLDAISTITIRIPNLSDRIEDLGILAHFFLERCNRNNSKQVGSILPDALDSLALYSWPGELDQLSEVIAAAHAQSHSPSIANADLPPIVHQAFQAASRRREPVAPIVLDDLLASIEKEAITRALAVARGNKSEAAALLGMTRPRFYRRLVQLGFVVEVPEFIPEPEVPEFIEHDDSR